MSARVGSLKGLSNFRFLSFFGHDQRNLPEVWFAALQVREQGSYTILASSLNQALIAQVSNNPLEERIYESWQRVGPRAWSPTPAGLVPPWTPSEAF